MYSHVFQIILLLNVLIPLLIYPAGEAIPSEFLACPVLRGKMLSFLIAVTGKGIELQ